MSSEKSYSPKRFKCPRRPPTHGSAPEQFLPFGRIIDLGEFLRQIKLISGHESKKSLDVYQHLSLELVEQAYQDAVQTVGI